MAFIFFILSSLGFAQSSVSYDVEVKMTYKENNKESIVSNYQLAHKKVNKKTIEEVVTIPNTDEVFIKNITLKGTDKWRESVYRNKNLILESYIDVLSKTGDTWTKWTVTRVPFECSLKAKCFEVINFQLAENGKIIGVGRRNSINSSVKEVLDIVIVMTPKNKN